MQNVINAILVKGHPLCFSIFSQGPQQKRPQFKKPTKCISIESDCSLFMIIEIKFNMILKQ